MIEDGVASLSELLVLLATVVTGSVSVSVVGLLTTTVEFATLRVVGDGQNVV